MNPYQYITNVEKKENTEAQRALQKAREFDSCIIKKVLVGRINPVLFCQIYCFIVW